ncbi:MAG: type II secretion system F family protein [Candidatus Abyssubacteria bacterium]|nr:type II secretion system F family protein [Candidatus Abyssubacteria bacterium]
MQEQKDKSEKNQSASSAEAGGAQVRFEGEPSRPMEEESVFDKILGISLGAPRIPQEIITSFLRQLVMLLEAGVPLLRAITTLSTRVSHRAFDSLLKDVADRIESGNTLWQSLSHHPKYFNHLFVSVIKAGESSGTLTQIITRLADYREKRALLRRQVQSAMAYPLVIFAASIAVLILFLVLVLPEFETLFISFDIELPAITRWALAFAHGLVKFWWLWIAMAAALVGLVVAYGRTPSGRLNIDRWKLKVPIFGRIMTQKVVADFAHTFATLLNAGISILETLDLTKEAVGNTAFAQDLQQVRESIERGEGLEKPLRRSKVVPPIVTDMLATGEEAGALDRISLQMAVIFEKEVENSVNTLKSLIEPIMILGLGLVVMFLTLSFFWPYISIINQVSAPG